jgi:hypothetical protein
MENFMWLSWHFYSTQNSFDLFRYKQSEFHQNFADMIDCRILLKNSIHGLKIQQIRFKSHLVVVGSGWGGFRLATDVDKNKYDVTVLSPRNHFLFTPLLPSTSVGTLEFRCVQEPVRTIKGTKRMNHLYVSFLRFYFFLPNFDLKSNLLLQICISSFHCLFVNWLDMIKSLIKFVCSRIHKYSRAPESVL